MVKDPSMTVSPGLGAGGGGGGGGILKTVSVPIASLLAQLLSDVPVTTLQDTG